MANEMMTAQDSTLSFGIQDTMEMGQGSSELLNDLLSPETATADADKLKDINEEEPPAPKPADGAAKPKTTAAPVDGAEGEQGNGLDNFLNGEEEDDDKEEIETTTNTTTKKPVKTPNAQQEGDEEDDDDDTPEPGSGTQFEALANDLFSLGIFNKVSEDEEVVIKTPEEFLERFREEKKRDAIEMVDGFIGQYGQEYQDAFDAIYVKGINPRDYFTSIQHITDFTNLDLTKEPNQEKVVRQALTDQGFEPEDVDSEIERLKNYGDLETVSQKHHKVLIKKESTALAQKTAQAEALQKQKLQTKQQYINNVNTVLQEKIKEKGFDGIPLNPKTANELQDFLLVDKWKTDSGETLTDFDRYILELKRPENHATKVKVGLLIKLLQQDPSLSTIQKSGVTSKTNTLFKEVQKVQKANSNGTSNNNNKPAANSWFK